MAEDPETTGKFAAPLPLEERIISQWTDYNGHLNVAWITWLFDRATDNLLDWLGLGEAYAAEENCSTFALEAHVRYLGEAHEGDTVLIRSRLVDLDNKRMHYVHEMRQAQTDEPLATLEQLSIHVDLNSRRAAAWNDTLRSQLSQLAVGPGEIPLCGAIRLKDGSR